MTGEVRSGSRTPREQSALRLFGKRVLRTTGKSFAKTVGPGVLRALARSWHYEVLHPERREAVRANGGGVLLALWHGRMLPSIPPYFGEDFAILVSPSDDGDVSEALLRGFRYAVIRGSSSHGGAQALREMIEALKRGSTVAVTPDGPRGPRHSMNRGLAWMAKQTGFPILPAGFACQRAWRLGTWDRYAIPKPGTRIVLSYGEAAHVHPDTGRDELQAITDQVRHALIEAERAGFRHLGQEPDF